MTEITNENFQSEVIESKQLVLIDFWSPHCSPCRAIAPMLEELSTECSDSVKIGKINTDDFPELAVKFHVDRIPTLMFFKASNPVETLVGVQTKSHLKEIIERLLDKYHPGVSKGNCADLCANDECDCECHE